LLLHRSFQILILSGFLLLTGLAGAVWNYVFTIQETTAQINRDWNEFTNASNAKGQLLGQIGMSLGYTGFIHNFKNYVIRHDPEYKRTVEAEFQRTSLLLDKYAALTNSPDERAAIETIRATVLLYRQELEVAAYQIGKGADISEIDKAVRVDDAPAKTALELLETTWRVAFDEGDDQYHRQRCKVHPKGRTCANRHVRDWDWKSANSGYR
jgi:hypothetical protein